MQVPQEITPKEPFSRRTNFILVLVVLECLAGFTIAMLASLSSGLEGLSSIGWLSLGANGLLVGYVIMRGIIIRTDWFQPLYFVTALFALIFFFRPLQILFFPEARLFFFRMDTETFEQALLLGTIGFVSFYIGYGSRIGSGLVRRLPSLDYTWKTSRLLVVVVIFTVIGLAGYLYAISRSGGLFFLTSTLRGRILIANSDSWLFASTIILLQVNALLLGAHYFAVRRLRLLFLSSLLLALMTSLLLGGRSNALIILLSLTVIMYYQSDLLKRSSLRVIPLVAGILIIVFIIVVFVGRLRNLGLSWTSLLEEGAAGLALSSLGFFNEFMEEFNQFDWLTIALDLVPSQIPYQWGSSFLQFFAMFVPSAFWSDKPSPIAFLLNLEAGGAGSGSPPSLIGELYMNFSAPGVVLGMLIFGAILRAAYSYFRNHLNSPAILLLYAYFFSSLHRFFTRSFAPKLFGFVLFIVPTLLAIAFVFERRERIRTKSQPIQQEIVKRPGHNKI